MTSRAGPKVWGHGLGNTRLGLRANCCEFPPSGNEPKVTRYFGMSTRSIPFHACILLHWAVKLRRLARTDRRPDRQYMVESTAFGGLEDPSADEGQRGGSSMQAQPGPWSGASVDPRVDDGRCEAHRTNNLNDCAVCFMARSPDTFEAPQVLL